jgi:hypothetical protein
LAPLVTLLPGNAPEAREAFGRLKPIVAKLNESGMFVSDRVHICEIVVIPASIAGRASLQHFAWSLAVRWWRRYKPPNSTNAFQGRNHGD